MRVSLDFDEVLFPFMEPFLNWLNPQLVQSGIQPIELTKVVNYDVGAWISVPLAKAYVQKFYSSAAMMEIEPERFATAGVKALLKHGHEVIIVTGRPDSAAQQTEEQLVRYFPRLPIHYTNQYHTNTTSKAALCHHMNVDVHVDDQIPHINDVITFGIRGIFVQRPWGYTVPLSDDAILARSWHEILGGVLIDHHCHV